MTRLLIVDDTAAVTELFADAVAKRLEIDVDTCIAVEDVELFLDKHQYDLFIADLSFPQELVSGLDALVQVWQTSPTTKLAIMTQGDAWVGDLLRDAWELLPITTVISKTAPLDYQIGMIEEVLETGSSPIDPAIQAILPTRKNPARTPERFASLIQHQGHAKVWRALLGHDFDATYKNVSAATGLKLNTVKNYRTQLLVELRVHGLEDPTLREMQHFAWRNQSFLEPHVAASLGDR